MTTFEDGPAKGETLTLKRSPKFLRVTTSTHGDTDALDQIEDEPAEWEQLHAYELTAAPLRGFIDGTRYREPFTMARYRLCQEQPADATMRDKHAWRKWCYEQVSAAKNP